MLLNTSCTHNPLFPLKKTEQTKISGTVCFSDGLLPENTFVWMENFNLCTYTKDDGKFEFTLSPAVSQGIDCEISGFFAIYFYHPNYILDSVHVKLFDGKIAKNQENIDTDGKFLSEITLNKFFSQEITIVPIDEEVVYDAKTDEDSLRIIVKLKAYDEDVIVKTRIWNEPVPETTTNTLRRSGVYFYSEENNHFFEYLHKDSFYYEYQIRSGEEISWNEYVLPLDLNNFYSADYKVIPYIMPLQEIPLIMRNLIGVEKFEFGKEYLTFPLQKNSYILHVDGTLD